MKTILLVDDDRQLRTVFGVALRKCGYNVVEAESGSQGIEAARQHLPDLILSDINMPGGDGSTLLREIRTDPELRSRQVVLMTGKPDMITPRKGMEKGADDFLLKPVSLDALKNCVQARLERDEMNGKAEERMLVKLRSAVHSHLPHEFFTPVAGIIGLMEVLRAGGPTLTTEEVNDIHNDVYQSALRLNRTLRNYLQILDVQTMPEEELLFPLVPRQAEESVETGVREALKFHDRRQDVSVRVEACAILVKPGDLGRIVEELVDNALKFSPKGSAVEVILDAEGRMSVTDYGRGLSVAEINRIGAFQQFDRKKYEQQGLGLGLVLVQKLAAFYHAEFSLTSEPGQGTQVHISFPLAAASRTPALEAACG